MELWDNVKGFYKEKFDIEPEIVELFCDFSVLLLCVSGSSNKSIANFLDMDIEEVRRTIGNYYELQFYGWTDDLPVNPIRLYNDGKLDELFKDSLFEPTLVVIMRDVCRVFVGLERKLNDNWI